MKSITELINESLALRDKKWRANKKAIKNPHEYLINKASEKMNDILYDINQAIINGYFTVDKTESESGLEERYIVNKENIFTRIFDANTLGITDEMQKDILKNSKFRFKTLDNQKTVREILHLLNPPYPEGVKFILLMPEN